MKLKNIMSVLILLWLCFFRVTFIYADSESCKLPSENQLSRTIDGPANVRERPDDATAIVASLDDGKPVVLVNCIVRIKNKKRQLWYYIEWNSGDQKKEGWTFERNIRH